MKRTDKRVDLMTLTKADRRAAIEALRPFAAVLTDTSMDVRKSIHEVLTVGDFRRARATFDTLNRKAGL